MNPIRIPILLSVALLGACAAPPGRPPFVQASQPGFAAFGEDEDACRRVGAGAVGTAPDSGPADAKEDAEAAAAHRYDRAYGRCMMMHARARQMQAAGDAQPDPASVRENLHSFDYPDAFYHIPYATPGYGYDGFSY